MVPTFVRPAIALVTRGFCRSVHTISTSRMVTSKSAFWTSMSGTYLGYGYWGKLDYFIFY